MKNKVALITGASRGIGKAIALKLASLNYDIIINYNNSKIQAEELMKEIKEKFNVNALIFKANIAEEKEVNNLFNFAINNFGKIDILINNAGICLDLDVKDRTVGHFMETFKTNVFGLFQLSRLVGFEMVKNKYGKIINLSSNNSINCFYPTTIDYDASKSAINSITKNLAIEFSPFVNVNAIAPGWINTDMNKDLTPDIMEFEKERILKKRIGTPEDVANLTAFLVSDEANYINGEVIVIDGGMF